MHRASAAEFPFATLSHHIFDSTHIAYGVVTAAIDRGPFVVEASLFNGREPDEHRWDFDLGALDSVSGACLVSADGALGVSGLERPPDGTRRAVPGNVQRTTVSASWLNLNDPDFSAVTIGYGVNATDHGTRHAVFAEGTRHVGRGSTFFRTEVLQVETHALLGDADPLGHDEERKDVVGAVTLGGVRNILGWRGFEGGLGAAVTFYAVPEVLQPSHGRHPVSFQLFFRLRPPAGNAGRMWNRRMAQPMVGHTMDHSDAGSFEAALIWHAEGCLHHDRRGVRPRRRVRAGGGRMVHERRDQFEAAAGADRDHHRPQAPLSRDSPIARRRRETRFA